ncbi:hypothetical protein NP233_g10124 [Leucocoprinus birnbaumii]|uniref:Very-long-chain 3-oxoacyl-CoA reductase n=1 Tax=Leucocoprinus birnbaumii TaxID=56174 RepID=A0AAD5VJV4_9AGAR|nr:hypothetical protein NP233_g10124 [Leucocoprinus birnbaumii]
MKLTTRVLPDKGHVINLYPLYITVLGLGAFTVLRILHQLFCVLLQTFLLPGTSLTNFGSHEGAWAVVTGCTDGIGKEFARQLGKAGFNLLLVARDVERLSSTAQEIELMYGIKTHIHTINFGKASVNEYTELTETLERHDIGVLVNNVGTSWRFSRFTETPREKISDMIQINVNATVQVTHAVLPGMVKRKRGLVLNVGSFSGAFPIPMLAAYSSTKAFLANFTSALAEEVRSDNVMVEYLNAYYVVTKLSGIRRPSVFIPTTKIYVQSVLSKIGLPCGSAYSGRLNASSPYWPHALLDLMLTFFCKVYPSAAMVMISGTTQPGLELGGVMGGKAELDCWCLTPEIKTHNEMQ